MDRSRDRSYYDHDGCIDDSSSIALPCTGPQKGAKHALSGPAAAEARTTAFIDAALLEACRLFALLATPVAQSVAMGEQARVGAGSDGGLTPLVNATHVLNTLSFSPSLDAVKRLWYYLVERVDLDAFVKQHAFAAACQCTGTRSWLRATAHWVARR